MCVCVCVLLEKFICRVRVMGEQVCGVECVCVRVCVCTGLYLSMCVSLIDDYVYGVECVCVCLHLCLCVCMFM